MEDLSMQLSNQIKKILIIVYKFLFRSVYNTASLLMKHDERKAVFALYRTNELDGNLKFIHDELKRQTPNIKIHLVYSENKMNLNMFKEAITISNARYLILDDYYLPIYLIKPKNNLKVIQLWHAAGALKKFGYSTVGTKFGPDKEYLKLVPVHSNYTHVYVSAKKFIKFYAEAFNMDSERVYPLGIPRIDLFNLKTLCELKINRIYNYYPELQKDEKVNILIAPTYRAKGPYLESSFNIVDVLRNIHKSIHDNVRFIFKAHPYMPKQELELLNKCSNVLIADKFSINEWMLISNAFITDYSSSVFEFALLKRPIAHFVPDYNEYKKNRGFYLELSEVSDGVIIHDTAHLINWVNARVKDEYFDTTRMIEFNFDNIEYISKQIVEHIIS